MIQRLLHLLTHLPERIRHAARRQTAWNRLRRSGRPASVLIICSGNLCRSPYAAAVLRQRLQGSAIEVESAGFLSPNRQSPIEALAAAAARNVDLSTHRSRTVNRALLDRSDLIVVMDPYQEMAVTARSRVPRRVLVLGDLDPQPITTREIKDPFGRPREAFDACYARIDRCIAELSNALTPRR